MKLFKRLFIPLLIALAYLTLVSYPYFFSKITRFDSLGPLSVIEERSEDIYKTGKKGVHLLKGEKITDRLFVTENNLGIVLVRFVPLSANVTDIVAFRIKEEGAEKWFYENNYNANQFQPDEYFTFGFQPIKDSKDKIYVFEVESLAGTARNGIGISPKKPQVALVYRYTRDDLGNVNTLFSFSSKKFIYVARNVNLFQNGELFIIFISSLLFSLYLQKKRKIIFLLLKYLPKLKKNYRSFFKPIVGEIISDCLLFKKKLFKPLKNLSLLFTRSKFYLKFLNTNVKKRLAIGLVIFLIAFLYRFSATLVDQLGVSLFYEGLGGQGDYDQFIRAATCALNFCPAILGQNFLIESTILGIFYEIFGFGGGLHAYLYLMLILSSIVATLPYLLLSRKHFLTIGGIIGSLYLSTSDYLTHMALNFPPDNGSLFTFSLVFIVYLLTLHAGTIRWLLFFGLMGTIDGLNKLILLINDLAVLILFVPVFLYEKANRVNNFPFIKFQPKAGPPLAENLKLIFKSLLPLLVFLVIYSAWEYFVQIKFATPYYLRGLIEGNSIYTSSTDAGSMSLKESFLKGNILEILYYYSGSYIVMTKRIIENAGLNTMLLAPILIGLVFTTFRKSPFDKLRARKFFIAKLISTVIFAGFALMVLVLFKNNYLLIQDIGQFVYAWSKDIYVNVFLFASIIFLFILNFRYRAIKYALPIVPYVVMLIILAKNAPEARLLVHVIAWSIILFSFLIDWILSNDKKNILKRFRVGSILLALFIFFYTIPRTSIMVARLYEGYNNSRSQVKYLRWVNSNIPANAIILAGGESDLVIVAQNLKRPIIYNSTWASALLIKPEEIPGVKPADFTILDQFNLNINEMPGVTPNDFSIILELKNKDNFNKNKYLILEDDINMWRNRLLGVADSVVSTTSGTLLSADDYLIKVYKSNSSLNKSIYELKFKETENSEQH